MSLKAFWKLARVEHSVFLALAVVIGEIVVTKDLPLVPTLLGVLSVFFIGIGSFTLNDFLDYPTDKKNKRKDRPLVTKDISVWSALVAAKISFPLGILFSLLINLQCFVIALVFSLFGILYSYYLKKLVLMGNIFIAFSMAIPFVYGNVILTNQIEISILFLSSLAFLMGIGREVIKSIQDMGGDKKFGRRTLPVAWGRRNSSYFAAYCILLAVVMSPFPFLTLPKFQYDLLYLAPIIITDVLLLYSVYFALKLKNLEKVRKMTLLALGIGLVGFLLGAL